MMSKGCLRFVTLAGVAASVLVLLSRCDAQFGNAPVFGVGAKKTVTLRSKLPPIFDARGKSVQVVTPDALMKISLEKQLTQSDSTITLGGTNADLVIECTVAKNIPVRNVNKVENGQTSTWMIGELSVIFRITEPRSKIIIKSDTASASVNDKVSEVVKSTAPAKKVFGMNVPGTGTSTVSLKPRFSTTDEGQRYLISEIAKDVAGFLVTTEEVIQVPLESGGPLNGPEKLAENGLWPRYLEQLQEIHPSSDAKAEAFRLYDIGVANEALAYQASDIKSSMKYLEEASNNYGKALDAKQNEKAVLDAQVRIKAALEHYDDMGKTSPLDSAAPLTTSLEGKPASDGAMTNNDVMDMVKAKMDEGNILDTIQHAPSVSFDLSPHAQIVLSQNGVNGKIIMAMKNKVRGASPPAETSRH
jgi:hypothetical protein